MKKIIRNILIIIPLLLVINCSGDQTFQAGSSTVPLRITINLPEDVDTERDLITAQTLEDFLEFVTTVSVIVQGNFPTISQLFPIGEPVIVFVPPGENRTFIVSLLNADGQAVCSGQTTVDIFPGIANEITIDCIVVDEICDDGEDNNGNDLTDCEENACAGSQCDDTNFNICIDNVCVSPPPPPPSEENICDDEIDNDQDGMIDCEDLDCAFDPACEEICDDEIDNDNDGNTDCLDSDCNNQDCGPGMICMNFECVTQGEQNCSDGIDNDGDNLIDCEDSDCNGRICELSGSACVSGECQEVACNDDINNDQDDLFGQFPAIDCDDEDCDGEACGTGSGAACDFNGEGGSCEETNCFDQINNDQDEDGADCSDFDCFNRPCGTGAAGSGARCQDNGECAETACGNLMDDDRDGLTDCNDPDCDGLACGDGVGAECQFNNEDNPCIETLCSDGNSNDGDTEVDCNDSDCFNDQSCNLF